MTPKLATLHLIATRVKKDGWSSVARQGTGKVLTTVLDRLHLSEPELPLRPEDIVDPGTAAPSWQVPGTSGNLRIGWVCTPPAPGSGGHTTFFRMVQGLEARGHQCTLFLHDRNDDDVTRHEATIRRHWPMIKASVRSATDGLEGVDAIVASSWPTAHIVAARSPRGVHPFYFIQDYEPYFYPRGAFYAMAEDSYRFGFTNVALGGMIAKVMQTELGLPPDAVVPFGCDTDVYRLLDTPPTVRRSGVVYYAKRKVDRRGYLLAKLALEEFHHLHPEQEIHIYGDIITGWNIPVTNHGNMTPAQLNTLYNQTIAGLAISFTNISLVPGELLAAGNVPVLNNAPFASGLLDDPDAVWAPATPMGLATALAEVVSAPDVDERPSRIAGRPRLDWKVSQEVFADLLEATCALAAAESPVIRSENRDHSKNRVRA
ncbi:glycosyltransferase family 1 protein [Paenarthrobacter sp. NPDC092416]|uniref:glycosyltransferase family 1 protein n=1 Tax=Paenarthrobacter sp. NPDC092416 TaxID=3364386 RepID=UPI00381F67A2